MPTLKPSRDIQPVTEFRANAANEGMLDELALLRDVRKAEQQVAAGKTLTHAAVAKKLRARLAR